LEYRVLAEPVLVGRERELEELQRYFKSAKDGKGKTVFVSAEAGIGKTRLMREFLNSAKRKEDIVTLSGWCLFNAGVPYFPFIEAFSSYYSTLSYKSNREEAELNSWLKGPAKADLHGKLEYLSPQVLKDQTFTAVAKTIHSIATRNPVILLIEDIHWADSASLALIHYIARAINDSERVLVLATFRSEEITTTSEGYPHQLVETLCTMRREDLFSEIKLTNLDYACVVKMAESMLGGSLQQELAEKLAGESEGNPLFIVESLRMLHERKNIVKANNQWRLAVDELGIPFKIKDIIVQRLGRLNYAQRKILDAASVIGEEFDTVLLSSVLEQDSLDVLETLNEIASSTSLVRADENQYRFDHARSREVLYEELAPPLKQGYHGRIAEKLESTKSAVRLLRDLAYHYAEAGNKGKAVKYALEAGKDELTRWSNVEAINHFKYVEKAIENNKELTNERATALEGLGDAFYANNMFKEAIETFESLSNVGKGVLRLRAFRKAMDSAFQVGDRQKLMELLTKADKYVGADRLESARVLMSKGRAFVLQWNMPASIENMRAALQVFEEEYSLWDVGFALIGLGACKAHFGMQKEGIAELLRAVAVFEELGDFRWQLEACYTLGYTLEDCLLEHEALEMFTKVVQINEKMKMGDYYRLALVNAFWSRLYEYSGNFEEALAFSLKALELTQKTDSATACGVAYSNLATQYAILEDPERSETFFNKLMQLPREILSHPYVVGPLVKAAFNAGQSRWKESNQQFEEFLKTNVSSGYIARAKLAYAWALQKQHLQAQYEEQMDDVNKLHKEVKERFEHATLQAKLMTRRRVVVGEEFEMRLDLVNVARKQATLVRVEGLSISDSKVVSLEPFYLILNGAIEMSPKKIDPFQVETIKLRTVFAKRGIFKFEPSAYYVDDLGETKKTTNEPIIVTVSLCNPEVKLEGSAESLESKFEFKCEAAEKAFNFLVSAFEEDFVSRKLPQVKSGWRTLKEVAEKAKISMYSVYGRYGKGGEATLELRSLGVLESRLFLGERGRGGHVSKIRINYENENVKRIIDRLRA
jgi:tetratricopeptide (TPR) repeat protein